MHLGGRSPANLPTSRGFDQHLGFLKGGEHHFDQTSHEAICGRGVDLWGNGTPAFGRNGTYSAELYGGEAVRVVLAHDIARPLFLYLAFQEAHAPVEVPPAYVDPSWDAARSGYNGMVAAMDSAVGNLASALRTRGMSAGTLVVFSADNGATAGGNNYPLRGMKTSSWEGGVRVAAFLWGGADILPAALRGTRHTGLIHICDWYATLSHVAGADPADDAAGVPPPDSIDAWPSLMVPNAAATNRSEVPLSWCPVEDDCAPSGWQPNGTAVLPVNGALIQGKYKLVWGRQLGKGVHWGPYSPNGTKVKSNDVGCPNGCLFDIFKDPTESVDVQADDPDTFARMVKRLQDIGLGVFQTNYTDAPACITGAEMIAKYRGFLGPPCGVPAPAPPPPPPPKPAECGACDACLKQNGKCKGNLDEAACAALKNPGTWCGEAAPAVAAGPP